MQAALLVQSGSDPTRHGDYGNVPDGGCVVGTLPGVVSLVVLSSSKIGWFYVQ